MPDVRYRGWLYAGLESAVACSGSEILRIIVPDTHFHSHDLLLGSRQRYQVTGTGDATPPRPCCKTSIRVRGRNLSLGARQRGIAHRFPSTRLRGMDSQHSKRRQKGVEHCRLFSSALAARLIESGNWQLGAMGEVRSCTCCTPLSQPAQVQLRRRHPLLALALPSPRGCATTTRRPRSRRRPRIGAGWDPVTTKHRSHQQSNCLLRMSQTGRRLRYVCDEHSAVCICVFAYAPQSGMERQKPSR